MAFTLPNLKHLQHIVTVAKLGSITAAAQACNISQPALSNIIKEYEALLGFQIFLRNRSKGVAVTPSGRKLLRMARDLLEDAKRYQTYATGLTETLSGSLDIACYTPLTPYVFPLLLSNLQAKHPEIDLDVREGDMAEIFDYLRSGAVDVAITYDMYVDEGMRFEPFAEIVPQVALRSDDPLAKKEFIRISDIANRPMIVLDLPSVETFIRGFLRSGGADPSISFRVKSPQMMSALVGAGAGFAIFFISPLNTVNIDGSLITFIPLENHSVTLNIGAVMPAHLSETGLILAFLESCRDIIREQRALEPYVFQV